MNIICRLFGHNYPIRELLEEVEFHLEQANNEVGFCGGHFMYCKRCFKQMMLTHEEYIDLLTLKYLRNTTANREE